MLIRGYVGVEYLISLFTAGTVFRKIVCYRVWLNRCRGHKMFWNMIPETAMFSIKTTKQLTFSLKNESFMQKIAENTNVQTLWQNHSEHATISFTWIENWGLRTFTEKLQHIWSKLHTCATIAHYKGKTRPKNDKTK